MPRAKLGYGFGGFPVVPIEELPAQGKRQACFVGIDSDLSRRFGRSSIGAASFIRRHSARMIPAAVKRHRVDWLKGLGEEVDRRKFSGYDIGLLTGEATQISNELSMLAADLADRNYMPMLVACNHLASLWHFAGVTHGKRVTYVYIDAHFDLGIHNGKRDSEVDHANFVARIASNASCEEVVNIGARAWSTYDKLYLPPPITCIRFQSEQQILNDLAVLRDKDVYISIDADVIDPSYFPNAACPEPFGLSPSFLLQILHCLSKSNRIVGADFCELVADDSKTHTAEIAVRFLYELMV